MQLISPTRLHAEGRKEKHDLAARIIGGLVFSLGIGILIVSFVMAYGLFTSAGIAAASAGPDGTSATAGLGQSALSMLIKIGALFIMVMVGSLTAGRGLQMYFAGDHLLKIEE